jgi:hypothetical protein
MHRSWLNIPGYRQGDPDTGEKSADLHGRVMSAGKDQAPERNEDRPDYDHRHEAGSLSAQGHPPECQHGKHDHDENGGLGPEKTEESGNDAVQDAIEQRFFP